MEEIFCDTASVAVQSAATEYKKKMFNSRRKSRWLCLDIWCTTHSPLATWTYR